jgi:flagellar biosynthetic protein FliP
MEAMDNIIGLDSPLISIFLVISFLSFLPAVLVMFTSFTRIVVILSFVKQALGGQQIPPNMVVIGLSLFLTLFIMAPVIEKVSADAVTPYMDQEITASEAFKRSESPLKTFMLKQTSENDIALFLKLSRTEIPDNPMGLPLKVVVPAFAISELKTALEIGFLIFIPFIVIDMVVASILLSMGMMMLPPALVSMPFKILLFVLIDGWNLVVGTIVRSFA